ncbi:MAG: gluconate 2-dehydrogenase subunit 3 family protein [Janthinobacterium lividum]
MSETLLPILQDPAVLSRTSAATRRALEERARPSESSERFLSAELFQLLEQITAAILPQGSMATDVDIASVIDQRLLSGKHAGWRFADLPADGEAYRQGLTVLASMLQRTPGKSFQNMPTAVGEAYLQCVANGDMDAAANFPLSKWLTRLRVDTVQIWMAHPSTMLKMEFYGFADGETGSTDGATDHEGWLALTPDKALPFEQGITRPMEVASV